MGPHPPGLGLHLSLLCSAGGFPRPLPREHPTPGSQRGKEWELERRKAMAGRAAAGRDCGRCPAAGTSAPGKPCTCSKPGGSSGKASPPVGRPILSPAPESPGRGGRCTPRLPPITHCSSPRVRGARHERCRGTGAPREPAPSGPAGRRRLTFRMLARGRPTWICTTSRRLGPGRPGGAGAGARVRASRSGRWRRRRSRLEGGRRQGGCAPRAGARAGPGGAGGRGGGAHRSPHTRARAALNCAPRGHRRRAALSPAAALTHIPSIPGARRGGPGGRGTRHLCGGPRGARARAWCARRGSGKRLLPGGGCLEAAGPRLLPLTPLLPKAASHSRTSQVASATGAGMALGGEAATIFQCKLWSWGSWFPYPRTLPLASSSLGWVKGFHKTFLLACAPKERRE